MRNVGGISAGVLGRAFLPMNDGSWSMGTKCGRACILLASASSHSSISALQRQTVRVPFPTDKAGVLHSRPGK